MKTVQCLPCNWGDYRIPDSGDLDNGAAEFCVNPKYQKNGWENFVAAHESNSTESPEYKKARMIEEQKWWK
jgi:hypothetical protein